MQEKSIWLAGPHRLLSHVHLISSLIASNKNVTPWLQIFITSKYVSCLQKKRRSMCHAGARRGNNLYLDKWHKDMTCMPDWAHPKSRVSINEMDQDQALSQRSGALQLQEVLLTENFNALISKLLKMNIFFCISSIRVFFFLLFATCLKGTLD